mmetsp:Transcript_69315/g.122364  ORF Transcript_69315/g.122364 Transcript_69315/m.122364 type:complete len:252 (+) Transcript_69315:2448-3203(+)
MLCLHVHGCCHCLGALHHRLVYVRREEGHHALNGLLDGNPCRVLGLDPLQERGGELGQAVHEAREDVAEIHPLVQQHAGVQVGLQRGEVELIREHLNDAFHEVLLCNLVSALDDNLKDTVEHRLARDDTILASLRVGRMVHLTVHPLELGQTHKVEAHKNAELLALLLPLLLVADDPLRFHSDPQSHHFMEVLNDEIHGVFYCASFTFILVAHIWQPVLGHLGQVVAKEQPPCRMLHSFTHFHKISQNLFG